MILHDAGVLRDYAVNGWFYGKTFDQQFRENVARVPDRAALIDPDNRVAFTLGEQRRLTYAELDTLVDTMAAGLLGHGVRKDDIVVCQLPNIVELITLYLATTRLGALISAVPMQYDARDVCRIIDHLHPKCFVSTARFRGQNPLANAAGAGAAVIDVGELIEALPEQAEKLADYLATLSVDPDEIVTLLWTSGTTGWPKCVPRTHNNWFAVGGSCADGNGMADGSRLLAPMAMVNMGGIGGMFAPWLEFAGTLVLHQPFDIDLYLRQIVAERITHTVAAPSMLKMLLAADTASAGTWDTVEAILCGSAPVDASTIRTFSERFGVEIMNSYGSNEGLTLSSGPDDPNTNFERRASFFARWTTPHPARRISAAFASRLVDLDSGEEITEPCRPGELQFKSPSLFPGYLLADGSLDRASFTADGYLRSGELFEIAGDGPDADFYHYVDRLKDVINRGGVKIPAGEIEALLQDQPEIAEAALIGVPDEILGQRIGAVIAPHAGHTPDLSLLNARLEERGVPKYMRIEQLFTVDALPRNPIGKVLKYELVDRFRAPLAASSELTGATP